MRRIFLYLLCSFGFLSMAYSTQAESVTQTTATATNLGLYGGEVRYTAIDPSSNYVYVGTYSPNGIFISSDAGATFTGVPDTLNFGEPRGVAVNSVGDLFVLADAAYKSTDHGATFTEMSGIGAFSATLLYANNTLVIGRTDGAVSLSTNDGSSFTTTTVQSGSIVQSLAVSPTAGTFYAVLDDNTNSTLYKTSDNGVSWSQVTTSQVTSRFYLIGVEPANANDLILTSSSADAKPWQSLNGGSTWSQLNVTPYATKISFDSTGRIYLGVDYSDDHGATWSSINQTTPISRVSGMVVPDPHDDNTLYAGSFAALAKSTDRGLNWSDSNQGITAVTARDLSQSSDKNTVWVATNAGLAKTTNFLDSTPTWQFPIYYDSYPESVWVSPADANTVVVGGMGAVVRTTDGGTTWTTATGWTSTYTAQQIISDPADSTILYAAANVQNQESFKTGDVFKSTDSGSSWTSLNFPNNNAAQAIALGSDGTLYVGIGNLNIRASGATGIMAFKDNAWLTLTNAPAEEITSVVVDSSDANIVYATAANFDTNGSGSDTSTASGYYKSTDKGDNWTKVTSGLDNATKFRAISIQTSTSPHTLYLSATNKLTSAGEIYKSTDAGVTWGLYYTGLKAETFNTLLFDGLIAGNTRGVYGLQSLAKVTLTVKPQSVSRGAKVVFKVTLKDSATGKVLKNRRVGLYRQVKGKFKLFKTVKTDKNGVASLTVKVQKNMKFKAQFNPKRKVDVEEFAQSASSIVTVKVK